MQHVYAFFFSFNQQVNGYFDPAAFAFVSMLVLHGLLEFSSSAAFPVISLSVLFQC